MAKTVLIFTAPVSVSESIGGQAFSSLSDVSVTDRNVYLIWMTGGAVGCDIYFSWGKLT